MVRQKVYHSDAPRSSIYYFDAYDVGGVRRVQVPYSACARVSFPHYCFAGGVRDVSQLSKDHVLRGVGFVSMPYSAGYFACTQVQSMALFECSIFYCIFPVVSW